MSKKRKVTNSFAFAIEGIVQAFKSEPNFRIHIFFSILVIGGAFYFQFSQFEWLIVFFTIAWVLVLELVNTSFEKVVDIASPRYSLKAKFAKDVSAAAVLLSAILALVVAALLFIPKVLEFVQSQGII